MGLNKNVQDFPGFKNLESLSSKAEIIAEAYSQIQSEICDILENADGKGVFVKNKWNKEIGSGVTCVLQNGTVIEKGAVNFSNVEGEVTPDLKNIIGENAHTYCATGISSIIHPLNPFVPIIHMNVRYFLLDNGTEWFGGGIDLTPHYIDKEEASAFHKALKEICDKYHPDYYREFKKQADEYFYLPHRNETRGIGGIFFDRIKPKDKENFNNILNFTLNLAKAYPEIYAGIMDTKRNDSYTDANKRWQRLRRGRYIEFNLMYDKGTKFGLKNSGNTESILISLPSDASWEYNFVPEAYSREFATLQLLKKGIDWIR